MKKRKWSKRKGKKAQMKCSIAMLKDKRRTLYPKSKNYSGFEILWKGWKWRQASQLCKDNNYQSMDPTVNLKRECFQGSGSKSGSSTCRCVRVRFILPGTRYPVYTGAVVVLRFISYTRVMLMTNDRPTARPTTSASAVVVVVASSLVPASARARNSHLLWSRHSARRILVAG
jgi:hypothetical protein